MILPLTGGCLCGAVCYEITAAPLKAMNCHCRTCQKAMGAAYAAFFLVPADALEITGVYSEYASMAASLDDPSVFKPELPKFAGSPE